MSESTSSNANYMLLQVLEEGGKPINSLAQTISETDDVLVHYIIEFLRQKYPATHPDGAGVLTRLVELSQTFPEIIARNKKAKMTLYANGFEESFELRSFFSDGSEMLTTLIEKIEA